MQNNNIKISVIVPVYNVEKYLNRCVDSILSQSFTDFELLLVDDGSSDLSGKLIDEYQKKDKRVKAIHQFNSGAFTARNNALKVANGKYVCFFDSDDYIDKEMLCEMYKLAVEYDSELVVSGFYIHTYYDDKNFITLDYIPYIRDNRNIDVFNDSFDFRKFAYLNFDRNMFYPPWNKMYKLSFIKNNNYVFPNTYRDDFPFVLSTIKNISNVCYTNKQYYHFIRKRTDSETQKYYANLYNKREEEHQLMIDLYKDWNLLNDNDSLEMISRRYIDRLIECMTNLFNTDCNLTDLEKKDEIKKYLFNNNIDFCLKYAKPKKNYLKLMYVPIKIKNVDLCFIMSKFINYIKCKNIALFSALKTNR